MMQFLGVPGRVAVTAALRAGAQVPEMWAARPPVAPDLLVLVGVLDIDVLAALTVRLDGGPDREAALRAVREDVDDVLTRALAPLEVRTEAHVCRSFPGGSTQSGDPVPYAAADPGWWTAVRLVVPLPGPADVTWTLRSPGRVEPPVGVGDLAVAGPGTTVEICHAAGPPRPWLSCHSALRFPHRHLGPPVHQLVC